jgi:protein-S-isoprenylcysteine O-methyltransferase
MAPLIVALVLLVVLTAIIVVAQRRGGVARSASRVDDRHSSMVLGLAHTAILVAAALFPALGVGALAVGPAFAWTAVGLMVAAFLLQLWAVRTLGPLFHFTLSSDAAQPIVERGPYRLVRHPGYLAQIVFFLAFAAATRNGWTLVVVAAALAVGYGYRIRTEERLLARTLGDRWRDYARRRARLVPGLF